MFLLIVSVVLIVLCRYSIGNLFLGLVRVKFRWWLLCSWIM